MSTRVDVAVVGGGLVGAAAALAAARAGRTVCLLDARRPRVRVGLLGHDIRSVALSPASIDLLEGLGISVNGSEYRRMHVWEQRGTARLDFRAEDAGYRTLGSIVPVGPAVELMWAALDIHDNATLIDDFNLTDIECGPDSIRLRSNNADVEASLLIAADGIDSTVRRLLAVTAHRRATGQQALATMVRTERPHEHVAYQCFLDTGPLALLPGPTSNLVSVVWSQSAESAQRRAELSDEAFCAELSQATERVLGTIVATDHRVVLPLEQLVVDDFHPRPRVVVIGDAARVVHPLAGLGVNLGFEDVAAVGEILQAGVDPDDFRWRRFARRRRFRARAMTLLMTAFQSAYGIQDPLIRTVRNTVVGALDRSPAIKTQLIKEALGLGAIARSSS